MAIRLRHYAAKNKLKRTIIHDIVAEMPDSQKSDVAMIFKGRQDNRFFLELKAFTGEGISLELLKTVFVDEAQAEQVFADLDKNEDGKISSDEFVDWCIQDLG